jgi:lysophospholipase L1-like esterase
MILAVTAVARPAQQGAAGPVPSDRAVARTDENSRIAHEDLLEKARRGGIDVYFAGDSITRRWGATDYPDLLANWTKNFFGWNAANFGWGADTTHNMLWRLENGELDGVHPKVIVLLAGTNNIPRTLPPEGSNATASDITRGVRALLEVMRTKAPEATIILVGILPRNEPSGVMALIGRINGNLAALADGRRTRYLDVGARLTDANGRLLTGVSNDGLHLTERGYQEWADALRPLLTEILGPPAREDHAPPPTGDPSVRGKAVSAPPPR